MKRPVVFLLTIVCTLSLLGCNDTARSSGNASARAENMESWVNESPAAEKQWTEQDILFLFNKPNVTKERTVLDCAIVTDGASDCVGVVLFTEAENNITNVAFIGEDGYYQQCGLHAKAYEESALTYLGNGAVSFCLETAEGAPYTCKITFSAKEGYVNFVVEDDL